MLMGGMIGAAAAFGGCAGLAVWILDKYTFKAGR